MPFWVRIICSVHFKQSRLEVKQGEEYFAKLGRDVIWKRFSSQILSFHSPFYFPFFFVEGEGNIFYKWGKFPLTYFPFFFTHYPCSPSLCFLIFLFLIHVSPLSSFSLFFFYNPFFSLFLSLNHPPLDVPLLHWHQRLSTFLKPKSVDLQFSPPTTIYSYQIRSV